MIEQEDDVLHLVVSHKDCHWNSVLSSLTFRSENRVLQGETREPSQRRLTPVLMSDLRENPHIQTGKHHQGVDLN